MEQFTREQAVKIYESGIWEDMTDRQIVEMQLFQSRLCMPFDVFQGAVCRVLGRDVYTHEFAGSNAANLRAEFLGEREAPTFEQIVAMIPPDKLLIV